MRSAARPPLDLRLVAITPGLIPDLEEKVRAAVEGGATAVQLRDKTAGDRAVLEAARRLRQVLPPGVALLVNDRVHVALAADAHGAHVGQEDLPAADARRLLGPERWLGVSVDTPEEAVAAEAEGADYVGAGPVFATQSKPDAGPVRGPQLIQQVRAAVRIPVVAIGGIGPDNAAEAIRAGAHGVAVISAIFSAPDPRSAAARLREAVERALAVREG